MLLAQAGVNEMLAMVKAQVNDNTSQIGSRISSFWQSKRAASPTNPAIVFSTEIPSSLLGMTSLLAKEQLNGDGKVTGEIRLVATEKIGSSRPSYLGFVELVAKVSSVNSAIEVRVKERRDLKIVDLSDPFLDKYALFVKSFCRSLNNPAKNLIVEGVTTNDPTKYSFAYLGNRGYPVCLEYPQGHKSAETPPVLLDLHFKDDFNLLGSFYKPGSFQTVNSQSSQASNGNLFYVNNPLAFAGFADAFSPTQDFNQTPELVKIYETIVNTSKASKNSAGTLRDSIVKDFQKAGGNPSNSAIFHSLIRSLIQHWQYHYGYSDYMSVVAPGANHAFTDEHTFSGIVAYFKQMQNFNPQRIRGGKMPAFFGNNRDIPIYIEGPVFLRFFKIAFVDQAKVNLNLHTGSMDVAFPPVPLHFEKTQQTFSGKVVNPPIDSRNDKLMSMPVQHFSINNFFFGAGATPANSPTTIGAGIEGYDLFPSFDENLRTVAHFYQTAEEFLTDRSSVVNGIKTLDLDGNSLVSGSDGKSLNLSKISHYRGKGRIILMENDCQIGDLKPIDAQKDSLSLYLMDGRFIITSNSPEARIHASLTATSNFTDNSFSSEASESGIKFSDKSVHIYGNLVVDNLFEMNDLPANGRLKITHDPALYFPKYPVRVSVGQAKSLLAVDYHGN